MPSLIFLLFVSNYAFQIIVPCTGLDRNLADREITVPKIPHVIEGRNPYGSSVSRKVDLSRRDKVRDQFETLTMQYGRMVPEKSQTDKMNATLDEVKDLDLEAALEDLRDAPLEAQEEGFPCPSEEVLKNAEQVLCRLHDTWARRYEVYPMPDGEVAIHARGGPGKSVALLFEPGDQVLCLVNSGTSWRRARYSNSTTLPDVFVIEALKELEGVTGGQIAT